MSTGLAFRTFTIRWVVLLGLASLSVNALTVTHPFANTNIVAGEDTLVSWSDVNAGTTSILGAILLVRRSKRKNEPERNIQRASNLFKDPSGHHGTGGFDETDNIKDAQHLHHQSQIQNQSGGYTDYRQPQYPAYAEPNNNYADYGYGGDNGGGYYPPSVPIGRFENSGYHRQSNVVSPSPGPGQNQGQNRGIPYSPPMQTMPAPMQEYSSSRYQYTPQLQFQPQWQEQQNYYDYPNDPTGGMNEMPPSHNQQGFYYPQYDQYDPYLQQQQQQQPPLPQHSVVNQPMAMPGYAPQQQQYPIDSRSPEPIIVSQSPPPPGANSNISDARQSRMSSDQRNSFDQRNSSEQRTSMPEDQRRVMSPTRAAQDSSKLVV
ncbi:hypothetical protein PHYBLDRAFT_70611 [Phycomyces blakesleeanus NRRL 1555(-)]|uniref:Uncharacterized protein n=1 Tax=Phycomyces blakesleeanus (strain ATCC 8743b / DSM 1359 / FGSC 10004 / NBRC 33097 / NRRL 1555) TaxID=763407 RepID=A0A167LHH4_PHYB8|nr:hypothetical protein PHYBLDRAFT_70611 [Phycomyces blakesleeanus NRRL 1555(-)]OAD70469.1 hypothetical protein PHYBLDRAFT_70611 [Phycomyces blakesleeanus NRRL 1555(-)]|eukprot:XP_018288509.1 hypothetical protein PHYBLDRAFT_70611 [Phycomyces blakesleeanus NRRL 1555(-)]